MKKMLVVGMIIFTLGVIGCEKKDSSAKADSAINSNSNSQKEQVVENVTEEKKTEAINVETEEKSSGNKVVDGIEYDSNGNMIRNHNTYYEYDAAGNVTKVTLKEENNFKEEVYAYDSAGNKIKEVCSYHEYWEEWAYDDIGRIIKYVKHRKSDDSIILYKEYNEQGKVINAFVRYSDGTEYPLVLLEYDEKGRIIKYSMYNQVDPKVYEGCEEYEYGDIDLAIKTKIYNYKNELIREIQHQYDDQGRIIRDDFQVHNSRGGHKGYILYTYEDNGNITQTEYINDIPQHTTVFDVKGNVLETKQLY